MKGLGFFILFISLTVSTALAQNAENPLIPYTSKDNLHQCGDYTDYNEQFEKALSCVDKKVLKGVSRLHPKIPKCFIIDLDSQDVHKGELFNFISLGTIFDDQVLGFYEPKNKTIYAVENKDLEEIVRHELQHYFLDIMYDEADSGHVHKVWRECESAHYDPLK